MRHSACSERLGGQEGLELSAAEVLRGASQPFYHEHHYEQDHCHLVRVSMPVLNQVHILKTLVEAITQPFDNAWHLMLGWGCKPILKSCIPHRYFSHIKR